MVKWTKDYQEMGLKKWRCQTLKSKEGMLRSLGFILVVMGCQLKNFKECDMATGLNFRHGYREMHRSKKDKTGQKDRGEG